MQASSLSESHQAAARLRDGFTASLAEDPSAVSRVRELVMTRSPRERAHPSRPSALRVAFATLLAGILLLAGADHPAPIGHDDRAASTSTRVVLDGPSRCCTERGKGSALSPPLPFPL